MSSHTQTNNQDTVVLDRAMLACLVTNIPLFYGIQDGLLHYSQINTVFHRQYKHNKNNNDNNKDLTIEIQRILNVKTNVISVIIGATGTI
jgi:hypothetical protein